MIFFTGFILYSVFTSVFSMESVYQLKTIETERLLLRPLCVGDAERLHKIVGKNLKLLNMSLSNFSHDGSFLDTQKFV